MKRQYQKKEESTHEALCTYIKLKYKQVLFHSDPSGVKLTIGQAVKIKRLCSTDKIPDLFLAQPKAGYCGLYLEIKSSPEKLYKKDGHIRKDEHITAQKATLKKLREKGYMALFAGGIDEGKKIIKSYMEFKFDFLEDLYYHQQKEPEAPHVESIMVTRFYRKQGDGGVRLHLTHPYGSPKALELINKIDTTPTMSTFFSYKHEDLRNERL